MDNEYIFFNFLYYRMLLIILLAIIIVYVLIDYHRNSQSDKINNIIKILARQCARWSTAAEQDKMSIIAVLHANYGAGYLWAIEDVFTPEEFKIATGLDYREFRKEILRIQDKTTRELVSKCPTLRPTDTILLKAIYGI